MSEYRYSSGTLVGHRAVELYFQKWETDPESVKVVIMHGLGEHSGRYDNLIKKLAHKEISIYSFDQRGHGRSGGITGDISSFDDLIQDLRIFIDHIKLSGEETPVVVLGHDLGALIALKFALDYPHELSSLICSSGLFDTAISGSPVSTWFNSFLSSVFPSYSIKIKRDYDKLSHDKKIVHDYRKDPLVHDRITLRYRIDMVKMALQCMTRFSEITLPLLVLHGTADSIVHADNSILLYKRASSKDKELQVFDGLYHEIINELHNEKVLESIDRWIHDRYVSITNGGNNDFLTA